MRGPGRRLDKSLEKLSGSVRYVRKLRTVEEQARELVGEEGIVTDIDRGRALWDLLRQAIERLRPVNTEPEPTPAWRPYAIAEGVYVRGKPTKEVVTELGVSPRTFHRERRAVVEALATVVWQIECQMRPGNTIVEGGSSRCQVMQGR